MILHNFITLHKDLEDSAEFDRQDDGKVWKRFHKKNEPDL
jgi:hypothetical protein